MDSRRFLKQIYLLKTELVYTKISTVTFFILLLLTFFVFETDVIQFQMQIFEG